MNQEDNHEPGADGESSSRLRFKGIVEASEDASDSMPWRDDPARLRAPRQTPGGAQWNRASRQIWLISRLSAAFLFCSVVIGWPLGTLLGYWSQNKTFAGFNFLETITLDTFLLAAFVPGMVLILGYFGSWMLTMISAAEDIATAARQYVHPGDAAAENARSVSLVVREQVDALNLGVDDSLRRLASVEAMIRQHVEAIETAGTSIETRATGAVSFVAQERARLIELTEDLNKQADSFATAIAEKARASIEALNAADDLSERAQTQLEERLARLDSAAQQALESFNALSTALHDADSTMRTTTQSISASADETQKATERAVKLSEAAAEAAARNAANVGASAARASEEAKKAADAAIETARNEAERASREAYEAAEREARRVAENADKMLGDVRKTASDLIELIARDTDKAAAAASLMSEAAQKSVTAAQQATDSVSKASEDAAQKADHAIAASEETARKVEARNKALAEARDALEAENKRLESLIDEQRKRADRLADAISTQTERLSKLAETQLREQEAAARLAEAQIALREREAAARAAEEKAAAEKRERNAREAAERAAQEKAEQEKARLAAEEKEAAAKAAKEAETAKESSKADANAQAKAAQENRGENVLDLGAESRKKQSAAAESRAEKDKGRGRLDDMADDIAQRRKASEKPSSDKSADKPLTLGAENVVSKRDKQNVSWREILDATDDAEPLDLAAASTTPPSHPENAAAGAIRMISQLQTFTLELETRLYGEPPPALRERFERGDRNVFANRLLRLNEADVKRRIRMESGRDKHFERDIHGFLQGFERLLEDATTSETADEDLEEYLSSPLGRVYLLIGATVGYFA